MPSLARAPTNPPRSIQEGLSASAAAWFEDPLRPRFSADVITSWDCLLREWTEADDLPLFIRKFRQNRGHVLRHVSGRVLVPTDNSPAHWSIALAFAEQCPTLDDVRGAIRADSIPVAMAFTRVEKEAAQYRCTRQAIAGPNELGWKVAHIEDVGLGYAGDILEVPLGTLSAHFTRFLAPSNIFLVPKDYAGIAETPEFIAAFRRT